MTEETATKLLAAIERLIVALQIPRTVNHYNWPQLQVPQNWNQQPSYSSPNYMQGFGSSATAALGSIL